MTDDRVRFQVDPELFEKAKKKTGLEEKADVFEALVKGAGTEIEAIPEHLRNLNPDVLRSMVKASGEAEQKRQFWNDVMLEARARKARADAIKAELEIQNLKVDNAKGYNYRGTPIWCFTHEEYEAPDSKCFSGMSESDRRVAELVHKK